MYHQLYWVSGSSLVLGIVIYALVCYQLSRDIASGAHPTRLEEKPEKAS